MGSRYNILSDEDVEQFLNDGYIALKGCFAPEFAAEWREQAFIRLGLDPEDSSTWTEKRIHMPTLERVQISEFAPKAWGAICDVLGGEERIAGNFKNVWGDCFIINFSQGSGQPWQPPSSQVGAWHKDGDFFRHFLDSPEQGLLTLVIWSDIGPKSGGTFFSPDSVGQVAKYLLDHPEGVLPGGCGNVIDKCSRFGEVEASVGDVFLIHPFMLHSGSQNPSGIPRFLTNPPVTLKDPMDLNRDDPDDYSLVERKILKDLGVERLDFQITAERERIVPDRVKGEAEEIERQRARLVQA